MIFKPHSQKQHDAIYSEKAVTCVTTGIQWGKTRAGAWWLKRRMHQFNDKEDNFIVTAPTYKIMGQSTLPAFLAINAGAGTYNQARAEFKIHGGGTVYFRTGKDPDSIVGITNVRGIWCDEAGKYSLYFWDNIEARAAFLKAPIILTTSPYSLNWIFTRIIKPAKAGERDDCLLVSARSLDNPYFPPEIYHKRKENMDPRRFNATYGGNFEKMQGLVYDCFDDEANVIEMANLDGARYFGGIDWGYTDPFVLKIRAITPEGKHYAISEFYKTGMILSEIGELLVKKMKVFPMESIYCDPSQPGHIEELQRPPYKAPCIAANNDILAGIDSHYDLIKSRRYKVLKGSSPHTVDEYSMYHWPEPKDLTADQDAKAEKPVDQYNHCMDTDRYISVMTHRKTKKTQPKVPSAQKEVTRTSETPFDISRRIRKIGSKGAQTENWS